MGAYHHIYMNNPTAGGTDGTMVSEGHVLTAPVSATLNAANNEEKSSSWLSDAMRVLSL